MATMAEASLAFPAICLALSLLFLVSVYNASIRRYPGAFYRHVILPAYQQVKQKVTNHNLGNRNPASHLLGETYEPINGNTKKEEDHSTVGHPSLPALVYHLPNEDTGLGIQNSLPESSNTSEIDNSRGSILYAGGPHRPIRAEDYEAFVQFTRQTSQASSPDSAIFEDEYDTDWSNSAADEAVLEPHSDVDDIPVWEFDIQRDIYLVDDGEQASLGWIDEIVEWTAEGVFAIVAPEIMVERD